MDGIKTLFIDINDFYSQFMLGFAPSRQDILGSGIHLTKNLSHVDSSMPIMQQRIDNIYRIYVENGWFDRTKV